MKKNIQNFRVFKRLGLTDLKIVSLKVLKKQKFKFCFEFLNFWSEVSTEFSAFSFLFKSRKILKIKQLICIIFVSKFLELTILIILE